MSLVESSPTAKVDLHTHKLRVFDSREAAARFAFENNLTAIPHERAGVWPREFILVLWNEATECMCGIIDAETMCTLPDW